jgi:hypothetical protein
MNIGELWIKLGIKADEKAIDNVNRSVRNLGSSLLRTVGLTVGAAGAVVALKRMTSGAMGTAVAMTNLSRKTGMSVEAIQRMQGSAVIVSQKEIQDINAANKEMYKLSATGKSLAMVFGGEVAKSMAQISKNINQYLMDNPQFIDQLRSVARSVGKLIELAARFLGGINNIISGTIGWKNALIALGVVWVALNIRNWVMSLIALGKQILFNIVATWNDVAALVAKTAATFTATSAILALAAAENVETAAVMMATKATWGFNAAWLANPITWIILGIVAAIGALIGIFFVLEKNLDKIQNFFTNIVGGISKATKAITEFFKRAGGSLLQGLIRHFKLLWQMIKDIGGLLVSLFRLDFKEVVKKLKDIGAVAFEMGNNYYQTGKDTLGVKNIVPPTSPTVRQSMNRNTNQNINTNIVNNYNGNADKNAVNRMSDRTAEEIQRSIRRLNTTSLEFI